MIVVVGEHSIELKEPHDLEQLRVYFTGAPAVADATLDSVGLGRLTAPGTASLSTTALHAWAVKEAGVGTDVDWERRWIRMVRQALSQGWATDGGAKLVARIEPNGNGEV